MIEIKNIVKSYSELKVLKGIDLTIKEKEIVTIVGASGAGKSTLLHILGTLDTPDEGELLYDSVNIARLSSNKLSEFRNNNIGLYSNSITYYRNSRRWKMFASRHGSRELEKKKQSYGLWNY